jgi:hypothetical protein
MMEETPTKVVSLLGVALTSMALLFMVSTTDASFMGTQAPVPDPFSSDKVVAVVDYAAAGYNSFLQENLFAPAQESYALASDNISWLASNAHDGLVASLGIPQVSTEVAQVQTPGRVAGAHIVRPVDQDPNQS